MSRAHWFLPLLLSTTCVASGTGAAGAPTFRLWGQLRDAAGPVAGARVLSQHGDTCRSDPAGNYAFAGLPAGPCRLLVEAPGREARRVDLWLRREAALPIEMARPARLAGGWPEDSLRLLAADAGAAADLDGNGLAERAGWRPLGEPAQRLAPLLPAEDGWGGPGCDGPREGSAAPGLHALGQPGCFSLRNAQGLRLWPVEDPGRSVWLEAAVGGRRGAGLRLEGAAGLWHRLSLSAEGHDEPSPHAAGGRSGDGAGAVLGHRWLAAPRLTLHQELRAAVRHRAGIRCDLPWALLPLSSAERWVDGAWGLREESWLGRAVWTPGLALRAEGLAWLGRRRLDSRGLEEDQVVDRLWEPEGVDSGERRLFSTRREDLRDSRGLRLALEQGHERGRFQAALELERRRRSVRASLGADSLLPGGRAAWLDVAEEATDLVATLRDQWWWNPRLRLEAALDLRYGYYDLRRRHVGEFQLSEVPDVAFNSDLLSLEPRFALRLGRGEASWQHRRLFRSPAAWWDPGQDPESLHGRPLVRAVGSEGELEALLPAATVEQAAWWWMSPPGPAALRLGLWARRWRDLPLPFWTGTGESLDLGRLTRPLDADEAGLELRLEARRKAWHAAAQASLRRARLEGLRWTPLPDTSLWLGRRQTLRALPGLPAAAALIEAGWRGQGAGLDLDVGLSLAWQGPRDAENAPGWPRQVPARLRLAGELSVARAAWGGWRATLWGRDLLDEGGAEAAWLRWTTDPWDSRLVLWPGAGRVAGLRLAWSPRP